MNKNCSECGSTKVAKVQAEVKIARDDGAPVYTCGQVSLCQECGFAQYVLPQDALARLREARNVAAPG
jgi:hypothetical protein